MTINRTTLLDLPLPVTGTESGTWGDVTNNGLSQYVDISIAGMNSLTSANFTAGALTIANTLGDSSATNIAAGSAQYATIKTSSLAANSTITAPGTARSYRIINADATYTLTIKASGQTGVTFLPGTTGLVAFNGTDYEIVGMVGPASATDNAVARFDSTTGQVVQNSGVTIDDSNVLSGATQLNVDNLRLDGNAITSTNSNGNIALTPNGTGEVDISKVDIDSGTIDGTVIGGSTAAAGSFTTLAASSSVTLSGGTANGVLYLDGSKVATSGSALTFDGTNLGVGGAPTNYAGYKTITLDGGVSGAEFDFKTNGSLSGYIESTSSLMKFHVPTSSDFVWNINSEQMRLTSTGLGIGTSSSYSKLYVKQGADGTPTQGIVLEASANDNRLTQYYSASNNEWVIAATYGSTGAFKPFTWWTSDTKRMTLDSSGNLGLGVTPSNAFSGARTIEVGAGGLIDGRASDNLTFSLGTNTYLNSSGNWVYKGSGRANLYAQSNGSFNWQTAPSGTAGNAITFTQAMTLSGTDRTDLLIGSTSGGYSVANRSTVDINGTSTALLALRTGGTNRGYLYTQGTDMIAWAETGNFTVGTAGADYVQFTTNNTERMRITSGGNLLLNTTSLIDGRLSIAADTGNSGAIGTSNNGLATYYPLLSYHNGLLKSYSAQTSSAFGLVSTDAFNLTAGSYMAFATGGTERMRIDSSGNLLVGTTSAPDANLTGVGVSSGAGKWAIAVEAVNRGYVYSATSDGYAAYFVQGGNTVGYISTNSTTTTYSTSSDYRLKENIAPMTGALATVAQLNPVTYNWKADGSAGQGFIAHELQEVVPDCVTGEKDAVDADGNPQYQGVDTSFLVATLTAAIQEQQAIIESLKSRLDAANL